MLPQEAYYPEVEPEISHLFTQEGVRLLGVAPPRFNVEAQTRYDQWLADEQHGDMHYLERHQQAKYHPEAVLPGCRSILVAGLNYYQPRPEKEENKAQGRVALYAWGRDYHKTLLKKLHRVQERLRLAYPEASFCAFTDTAPLDERYYAEQGGIGFRAKNTLAIHSGYGSWFFIGEILTTLSLASTVIPEFAQGACPNSCRRCINACPTDALHEAHQLNANRCISYLTIEHQGIIPEPLRHKMGDWVFGCDLCQAVCPFNIKALPTEVLDFSQHRAGPFLDLAEILSLPDAEAFRQRYAGSPILRPGFFGLLRNCSIVAANTGAIELLPLLQKWAKHTNLVVGEHAAWAVKQLSNDG